MIQVCAREDDARDTELRGRAYVHDPVCLRERSLALAGGGPLPARCTGRIHPRPTTCHCPSAARLGRAGDGNACNAVDAAEGQFALRSH